MAFIVLGLKIMLRGDEHTWLCSELIYVEVGEVSGGSQRVQANLEEISASYALLCMELPVSPGKAVTLRCEHGTLWGYVLECQSDTLGHHILVEFTAESRWSPERFELRHLLDPQSLLSRRAKPVSY